MNKFIFKPDEKGLFKALGFHHGGLTALLIVLGHFIGLGDYAAIFAFGWYASKEYKEYTYRGNAGFEYMDFLNPAIVILSYLIFI